MVSVGAGPRAAHGACVADELYVAGSTWSCRRSRTRRCGCTAARCAPWPSTAGTRCSRRPGTTTTSSSATAWSTSEYTHTCLCDRSALAAVCGRQCSEYLCCSDLLQNPLLVPLKQLAGGARAADLVVLELRWHPAQPWLLAACADGTLRLYA